MPEKRMCIASFCILRGTCADVLDVYQQYEQKIRSCSVEVVGGSRINQPNLQTFQIAPHIFWHVLQNMQSDARSTESYQRF